MLQRIPPHRRVGLLWLGRVVLLRLQLPRRCLACFHKVMVAMVGWSCGNVLVYAKVFEVAEASWVRYMSLPPQTPSPTLSLLQHLCDSCFVGIKDSGGDHLYVAMILLVWVKPVVAEVGV